MKRISLILLALGAVLASCSKHDDAPIINPEDAWMYDVNLPVPIQFGSAGTLTKAPVDPVGNNQFPDGKEIGVFGVNNDGNYWYAGNTGGYLWVDDANQYYVAKLITSGGKLNFVGKQEYYPMRSEVTYDFYGYYPYKNSAEKTAAISGTEGSTITYDIGKDDILWAKAAAEEYIPKKAGSTPVKGFNARYVRAITNDRVADQYLPKLEFEHKLSKLTFQATSGSVLPNTAVLVKNVEVLGTYNKATLIVSSRAHLSNPGDGSGNDELSGTFKNPVKGTVNVYNTNDETTLNVLPQAQPADETEYVTNPSKWLLGYSFILPTEYWASELQGKNLTAKIYLEKTTNGSTEELDPIVVTLPYPTSGYAEGYEYIYRFLVYDAQTVEVRVSLKKMILYEGGYVDGDSAGGLELYK